MSCKNIADNQTSHNKESQCPHRPSETCSRKKVLHHSRENEAASCRTTSRNSQSKTSLLAEVRADKTEHRAEETAISQADTDTLSKEDLVERRTERRHHDAEDGEECSCQEDAAEVSCICETTSEGADEEGQENLERAYPCYV